jgi:uncharacterized membrane protein (DUF485 family)
MQSNVNPLGIKLFLIYFAAYAIFIGLNAFAPDIMGREAFEGINLAVVYGMGLIVGAFVLSVIYVVMSGKARDGD